MAKWPLSTHLNPISVRFSLYMAEEIKKLSVVHVVISQCFNTLGHPLKGSLYDPALGPCYDRSGPCTTCLNNFFTCPGHMGHIELPLTVFNPLFYKEVHTILQVSCVSCHRILLPRLVECLLTCQLNLLDNGYVMEAQQFERRYGEINYKENNEVLQQEMNTYVQTMLSGGGVALKAEHQIKSIQSIREDILQDAFRKVTRKSCPNCGAIQNKIVFIKNKMMTSVVKEIDDHQDTVSTSITAEDAKDHLRKIWKENCTFIIAMVPVLKDISVENPTDVFFFTIIPVTPPRTRPATLVNGIVTEHQQNSAYKSIIEDCAIIRNIMKAIQDNNMNSLSEKGRAVVELSHGNTITEKLYHAWQVLQEHVDYLMDADDKCCLSFGLKQIIEKKEGLIRMHMMGKRVNYAARSVITPDPNLSIDEIGIPEAFAKKLTYPVAVTPWNVATLRKMVLNGPKVHPGALMVQNEDGSISKINADNQVQRESLAKRLLTPERRSMSFCKRTKIVHRHLLNGDVLLLNRQPTLHRPSIMGHRARILKSEKTLRLHYANCKAYNADFDGDEMNAHFPQNELARSEAYYLANVPNQYLVPKDGTPLSGLIQDHVISGVRLTVRGQFFRKEDYFGLVFHALPNHGGTFHLLKPAIIKPVPLWSGKQVLSTVIINLLPKGKPYITLCSSSKIGATAWKKEQSRKWLAGGMPFENVNVMSEAEVIIRQGELLSGVLDKMHYGATPYGLVHCVYELYGGACSINLLSAFAKLFTAYLQIEGFTLGVEDILIMPKVDTERECIIKNARNVGYEAIVTALNLTKPSKDELEKELSGIYSNVDSKKRSIIDRSYKTILDNYTNQVNKVCIPSGLLQKFPVNNLQLMVQSGAKGSTVNTMQISCLLGQIELEGKRPPLMISMKSLPSFQQFDLSPRAGGFVDGRFMTGIQPQEFFFHCMAGREGLIDTAVKTSRSGYLQRCLVKHLEGLVVNYDSTVRNFDGSVIQFQYGEDGMDIMKVQFLNKNQMPFLADNCYAILDENAMNLMGNDDETQMELDKRKKEIRKWKKKQSKSSAAVVQDKEICPDPIASVLCTNQTFGVLTERLEKLMTDYLQSRTTKMPPKADFQNMIYLKALQSHCSPGEPVGLLAAQSIGEPSTQMTLNTFHFAGRGEMNVTLGIPRLREILMYASKNIKTPSMDIPFKRNVPEVATKAEVLKKKLRKTLLSDVLQYAFVEDQLCSGISGEMERRYHIRLHFLPHDTYESEFIIKPTDILKYIEQHFIPRLIAMFIKCSKTKYELLSTTIKSSVSTHSISNNIDKEKDEKDEFCEGNLADTAEEKGTHEVHESSDDDDDDKGEEDAKEAQMRSRRQNQDYDESEEEEATLLGDQNEMEGLEQCTNKSSLEDESTEVIEELTAAEDTQLNEKRNKLVSRYKFLKDYKYDTMDQSWCEIILQFPLKMKRLDLSTLLKIEAEKAVVWSTESIKKAFTYQSVDTGDLMLKTDGVNLIEMFKYNEILDLNKLYSNDICYIAKIYGIEAARSVFVKEVKEVFNMYGITVDTRHLLLIGDYMTRDGTFSPLNRKGMEECSSPLQQISFESCLQFLRRATLKGKEDNLRSPSSRIMIGRPCINGTGIFSVLQKLKIS